MAEPRELALCVTVDLQLESRDLLETTADNLSGRFSYGKYGSRLGAWRLLELFRNLEIHASFFVPAADALRHPEIVEAIIAGGHEVAAHGWAMEDPAASEDREEELLVKSHEALLSLTGTPPVGWRTPTGTLTAHTLQRLHSLGYLYDSSYQDDDGPYIHRLDEERVLAEIPRNEVLSDAFFYGAHVPHTALEKAWTEEFLALARENDGLPCLGLNPRGDIGSGRAARIAVVSRFLEQAMATGKVRCLTCRELAQTCLNRHAQARLPAAPDRLHS